MVSISRRSFVAAGAAAVWLPTGAGAAEKIVLPGGHLRSGANLVLRGSLVADMLAIPIMFGARGPFLFEIATVGSGFSIRE